MITGLNAAITHLALTDSYQYDGEYQDKESINLYLHNRYLNTKLSRHLAQDSYILFNRYSSFNGNPITNIDPTGHNAKHFFHKVKHFDYSTALGTMGVIAGISRITLGLMAGNPYIWATGLLQSIDSAIDLTANHYSNTFKAYNKSARLWLDLSATVIDFGIGGYQAYRYGRYANETDLYQKMADLDKEGHVGKLYIEADSSFIRVARGEKAEHLFTMGSPEVTEAITSNAAERGEGRYFLNKTIAEYTKGAKEQNMEVYIIATGKWRGGEIQASLEAYGAGKVNIITKDRLYLNRFGGPTMNKAHLGAIGRYVVDNANGSFLISANKFQRAGFSYYGGYAFNPSKILGINEIKSAEAESVQLAELEGEVVR